VNPEDVIEIIDHRKINEADKFPNAKLQIELVGSAATLIVEKFISHKIDITKEAASLLYSAIISNTINFNAGVTTDRDRKTADWLKNKFIMPENYINEMFEYKSIIVGSIKEMIVGDFATFNFNNKEIGIAQLEILNVTSFMQKNQIEIADVLLELKDKESLDYIFISFVDLAEAFNLFFVIDESSLLLIENSLNIKFIDNLAKQNGILMRKQISPLIKKYLETQV